jgi:signal transduction histidine kinase
VRAVPGLSQQGERDESEDASATRDGGPISGRAPALNALLPALLSSARHELRSPIQSIQGFAELLESQAYGRLSDDQLTFVEHIVQGSVELSAVMDACLELVELEVLGRRSEASSGPRWSTLQEALRGAAEGAHVNVTFSLDAQGEAAPAQLDDPALKRAFAALFTALSCATQRAFEVRLEQAGDVARLRVARPGTARDPLLSLRELAERRRTCRGLIWLRLADVLFATQGALLLVGEQVDQAEVCIRLSSPH